MKHLIMYIYKITNKINQKIYIGKHASKRKNYWGSGKKIKLAIKKYGKENFNKEIIETCDDEEQLSNREVFWIKFFDARNELKGYNITEGGEGNSTICNGYWLNKNLSDKHRKNISLHHADVSGEKNPMFGKNRSELFKENLRKIKTGLKYSNETKLNHSNRTKGSNNPNSKLNDAIILNIRKEYDDGMSTNNLAEKYGVNKPCIWKIIHNYTWKHLT
jgi:group I intron endonuclease